ncbi:PFL-like glycyl radical enzymes motif protein [Ranid herpesvirus 3]|uniref:PFL-like glycyl radical enzymes motif protein n=1 Tax=Ranid herpesvirus 3 TaxID=1987509 RepID=A0A1X9T545_9VIRU|nr:PFL-like glycyl radical enzymes motif protein [Ranid herpesvirus 3]ARR28818.1 PFL-like glycyl radical enzymes motif protein [Ranid herpesvirus 3]
MLENEFVKLVLNSGVLKPNRKVIHSSFSSVPRMYSWRLVAAILKTGTSSLLESASSRIFPFHALRYIKRILVPLCAYSAKGVNGTPSTVLKRLPVKQLTST